MAGAGPSPGGGPPPGEGNWSRWGPDDERGALNLTGPDAVRRGMAAVRTGESVTLGLPMITGKGPLAAMRQPMQHFMARDGGDYAAGLPERGGFGFADDSILVACHGTTHLDALAHVWRDGQMWNGFPASSVTSRGAARCGIENAGPVVTRGLFLDFAGSGPGLAPGEAISAARLAEAVTAAGLAPEPGDALLLRTGWLAPVAGRRGRRGQLPRTGPGLRRLAAGSGDRPGRGGQHRGRGLPVAGRGGHAACISRPSGTAASTCWSFSTWKSWPGAASPSSCWSSRR